MVETGEQEETNNFKVFQDYFHETFIKHFKNISGFKSLIIEESLKPVINHLLKPIDKKANIEGIFVLNDKFRIEIPHEQVLYILRPDLDVLNMAIK